MIRFQKAARLIAFAVVVIGASLAIATAAGVRNEIIDEPDTGNLFEPIRSVVQHPRCMNCHVIDGIPRQYDGSQPHQQNVHGGPAGMGVAGLPCSTCHQSTNAPAAAGPNAPPGAPNWHLAPKEMFWVGATSRDICLRLRDPKTNGGKNFEELLHHFAEDPLVAWGWNPGGNRTVPPLTQEQTAAAVKKWLDAGAPCPAQASIAANNPVGEWSPSAEQISRMEGLIAMPRGASAVNSYRRYYSGTTVGNSKIVTGTFVAQGEVGGIKIVKMKDQPQIFDGGCSVVNLKYEIDLKRVVSIFCNGSA